MSVLGVGPDVLVEVQDEGGSVFVHPRINFTGAGVTATDNPASDRVDVDIPGGGVTDHGALTGLLDDDHTQYGALAQAETWAALQTFNAGLRLAAGQAVQDSGGAARLTPAIASPHVILAGEIRAGDFAGIGVDPSTVTAVLRLSPPAAAGAPISILQLAGNQTPNANVGSVAALNVAPGLLHGAFTVSEYLGMVFHPSISGSGAITSLAGIMSRGALISAPVTDFAAFVAGFINTLFNPAILNQYGLRVLQRGTANTTNVFGVKVEDITAGANRYLAWFGPSTPVLRLDAGIPAAGQTMLFLAEGVTPTVRRLQHMDPGVGGVNFVGGERVTILV